jgi:trans-2-enoyl-CoA reductase
VAGNDGLGVVVKAGPGVKNLSENDWVLPYKASMGTWRALAAWREKDVLKIPADLLPMEYGAMLRACPTRALCVRRAVTRLASRMR